MNHKESNKHFTANRTFTSKTNQHRYFSTHKNDLSFLLGVKSLTMFQSAS